jgi:multicomponent Na+:H+ antiporter subunit E
MRGQDQFRSTVLWIKAFGIRALALSLLWWVLTEGMRFEWGLPVLSVSAAALVSLRLLSPDQWRLRWQGLLRFVPYFVKQSLLGGVDVAWRSLHPRLPVRPGFVAYKLRIRHEPAQVFFALVVNLLPGTAVAGWDKEQVTIHALEMNPLPVSAKARELEEQVAALFGLRLED